MHLTYRDSKEHTGLVHDASALGTGAPEVTPSMREAGAKVIFEYQDDLMAWNLAEAVYRAMEQDRKDRLGRKE
jgi:hypothetical protein